MSLTCCTATCYPYYMNLKSAIYTVPVSGLLQFMSCHLADERPHVIHIAWTLNLLSVLSLYLDYTSICDVTYLLYGHILSTLHEVSTYYPYCPCIWITSVYIMSLTCCTATCFSHDINLKSAVPTVPVSGLHQYMSCHLSAVRPHVIHMTSTLNLLSILSLYLDYISICHVTLLLYGHMLSTLHEP